ncbi:hypothetical protein MMAN_06080 [Mycobacterium mantenii]|uniref:Uncharacterized protein n=1 Tax=Mycobacterium mantenii TaxID=560555 RepID=A0ABM7JLU4_MYCNT|nr:hypothetical protein MMAN_06080 [Mycobacterium mantenii]
MREMVRPTSAADINSRESLPKPVLPAAPIRNLTSFSASPDGSLKDVDCEAAYHLFRVRRREAWVVPVAAHRASHTRLTSLWEGGMRRVPASQRHVAFRGGALLERTQAGWRSSAYCGGGGGLGGRFAGGDWRGRIGPQFRPILQSQLPD